MRDIRNFTTSEVKTLSINGVPTNSGPFSRTSVRSQRSDIVPTIPAADGSYHRVTGYEAFFALTGPSPGKVKWLYFGMLHELEWTSCQDFGAWHFGCDPALLVPYMPTWVLAQVRSSMDMQVRSTEVDGGVIAGEARETARTLVGILKLLSSMLRAFRHPLQVWSQVTVADARRLPTTAAKAYLGLMYGILPLMRDVQAVAKVWDEGLKLPKSYISSHVVDTSHTPNSWGGKTFWRWLEGSTKRGVRSGASVLVLNPDLYSMSKLGLDSPLSIAWELTTLSFVVDWFTGIGSFIQTLEQPLGVGIADYWETQYVENDVVLHVDHYAELYENAYTRLVGPRNVARMNVNTKCMLRQTPLHLLPSPPYIRTGVSSQQAMSIIALLLARIR